MVLRTVVRTDQKGGLLLSLCRLLGPPVDGPSPGVPVVEVTTPLWSSTATDDQKTHSHRAENTRNPAMALHPWKQIENVYPMGQLFYLSLPSDTDFLFLPS